MVGGGTEHFGGWYLSWCGLLPSTLAVVPSMVGLVPSVVEVAPSMVGGGT